MSLEYGFPTLVIVVSAEKRARIDRTLQTLGSGPESSTAPKATPAERLETEMANQRRDAGILRQCVVEPDNEDSLALTLASKHRIGIARHSNARDPIWGGKP